MTSTRHTLADASATAEARRLLGASPPAVDTSLGAKLLPAVLSLIAGSTDVISFLGLGGLFAAHITGDLVGPVILGFAVGCGLGAACQAAYGLRSLVLPTGLALVALGIGMAIEQATGRSPG